MSRHADAQMTAVLKRLKAGWKIESVARTRDLGSTQSMTGRTKYVGTVIRCGAGMKTFESGWWKCSGRNLASGIDDCKYCCAARKKG